VLVTSNRTALIEMVPDTLSLHQLKAKSPVGTSLADHFFAKFVKVHSHLMPPLLLIRASIPRCACLRLHIHLADLDADVAEEGQSSAYCFYVSITPCFLLVGSFQRLAVSEPAARVSCCIRACGKSVLPVPVLDVFSVAQ
jgi:hypothetical protein